LGHIEALDAAGGGVLLWRSCGEAFQALQVFFAHAEFLAVGVAAALLDTRLTEGIVASGAYLEFGEQTPPQDAQALSTWTHNCHAVMAHHHHHKFPDQRSRVSILGGERDHVSGEGCSETSQEQH
jgi:hypothetical protein